MAVKVKKIVVSQVTRVALVDEGANLMPGLFKHKGEDPGLEIVPIMKSTADEEGVLYGIVYAPMLVDAHGHYMDAAGVKAACHSFGSAGMALDVQHGDSALDKAKAAVVESFIMRGHDDRFPTEDHLGREIQHEGAWAMAVQLHDDALKAKARSGELAELSLTSPAGGYSLVDPSDKELLLLKSAAGSAESGREAEDQPTMTDTNDNGPILEALGSLTEVVLGLSEKLAKTEEPEVATVEKKLDLSDPKALKKHRKQVAIAALQKEFGLDEQGIDSLSLDEFDAYQTALEELHSEFTDTPAASARKSLKKRETVEESPAEGDFFAQMDVLAKGKTASDKHKAANDRAMGRS